MRNIKRQTIVILLSLVTYNSYSQDTIYFDKIYHKDNCVWLKKSDNKPFTGTAYLTYFGGKRKREVPFVNGLINGTTKNYYRNGTLSGEEEATNGERNGLAKYYYKSGKLKTIGSYQNHKANGKVFKYREDGKLEQEEEYIDDQLNGETKFYRNEILIAVHTYRQGKMHGESKYYDSNGVYIYSDNYLNGQKVK